MINFDFHKKIETLSRKVRSALHSEEAQREPSLAGEGESGIMRIGVISDTHGQLRPEVLKRLEGCDYILHAGDFDREEVLDRLQDVAPTLGVRGNNDWGQWANRLPRTRRFQLNGVRFFMVHNRMDAPYSLKDIDVVVFGHSHRYCEDRLDGVLWLNPGSCGWPRFGTDLTMAIMTLDGADVRVERIDLSRPSR